MVKSKKKADKQISKEESKKLRTSYRRMKRFMKELESDNHQMIIAVPSLLGDSEFYKVFEFSALYYVYRLAERMEGSGIFKPVQREIFAAPYIDSILHHYAAQIN